jgi:GT2 family glycosyltransferase
MLITVVVTTYNRATLLREALHSLRRLEGGDDLAFEIVVVDNGSSDATLEVVQDFAARTSRVVRSCHEATPGVAAARNRGVREALGDWIAFFDDDQFADPRWLCELMEVARTTGAQCVGGRVTLAMEQSPRRPLRGFCRGLLGETLHGDLPKPFAGKHVPGTGNVLLHRRVFESVGPFDERLVQGAEDADFFRRARACGFAMWYAPAACVAHHVPSYRLSEEYLVWVASRHGANYAIMDRKERGRERLLVTALLRFGQALGVTVPSLLRAMLVSDGALRLERRCLFARSIAYGRQAVHLLAPRAFRQRRFFEYLRFRGERGRFTLA